MAEDQHYGYAFAAKVKLPMLQRDAYLYYEAGRAVAAAYQGLEIRHISGNPALSASEVVIPRDRPKARIIMWMTGMAADASLSRMAMASPTPATTERPSTSP